MQCFKWKTRQCDEGADICELKPRAEYNGPIDIHNGHSASLLSPNYKILEKQPIKTFGKNFFCLYNVSLDCPSGGSVIIQSSQKTNWAGSQDRAKCENYVAFTSDRDNKRIDDADTFCGGEEEFDTTLNSDSFLAIMWSTQDPNRGIFEFSATCNSETTSLDSSNGEGSGSGDRFFTTSTTSTIITTTSWFVSTSYPNPTKPTTM